MRLAKFVAVAALGTALLWSAPASRAAVPEGSEDGWYRWQVVGSLAEGSSCCFNLSGKSATRTVCKLDGGHGITISKTPCGPASGISVLYVRQVNGKPTRIRVFDADCEVSAKSAIVEMGSLSLDDSVAMLLDVAQARNLNMDVREEALIWLVQSNSDSAFDFFDQLLSGG